jgi:hypothetical protein
MERSESKYGSVKVKYSRREISIQTSLVERAMCLTEEKEEMKDLKDVMTEEVVVEITEETVAVAAVVETEAVAVEAMTEVAAAVDADNNVRRETSNVKR